MIGSPKVDIVGDGEGASAHAYFDTKLGKVCLYETNTYVGPTVVRQGTLSLGNNDVINPASRLVLAKDGTLDMYAGNRRQTFSDITCNGGTVLRAKPSVSGLVVDFDASKAGSVKTVDLALCTLTEGAALSLGNFGVAKLEEGGRYALVEFSNGVPADALDLSAVLAMLPEGWKVSFAGNRIVSEVDLGACDLIMLDTLHEPDNPEAEKRGGITDGQLEEKRFAWVKAEMARRTRPFFLAAHHPIDEITDGDWKALKDLIMETKLCVGWIHGHDHAWKHCLPSTGHWGDIGYAVAQSADHELRVDYHALDHYFPTPAARNAMDDDLLVEKRGAFMTFRW